MRVFKYLTTLLPCLGLAVAAEVLPRKDSKPHTSDVILGELAKIRNETLAMNDILSAWDGDLAGALPIQAQHDVLLKTVKAADVEIMRNSPTLSIKGALRVKKATKELTEDTRMTMIAIVTWRPKFLENYLGQQVVLNLRAMRAASSDLNEATQTRVPLIGRPEARKLAKEIDKIFAAALDIYDPSGES